MLASSARRPQHPDDFLYVAAPRPPHGKFEKSSKKDFTALNCTNPWVERGPTTYTSSRDRQPRKVDLPCQLQTAQAPASAVRRRAAVRASDRRARRRPDLLRRQRPKKRSPGRRQCVCRRGPVARRDHRNVRPPPPGGRASPLPTKKPRSNWPGGRRTYALVSKETRAIEMLSRIFLCVSGV